MGHLDPIETVYVTHEEGNEREKNGVKRGIGGFYGAKLLKRQGEEGAMRLTLTPLHSVILSGVGCFARANSAQNDTAW